MGKKKKRKRIKGNAVVVFSCRQRRKGRGGRRKNERGRKRRSAEKEIPSRSKGLHTNQMLLPDLTLSVGAVKCLQTQVAGNGGGVGGLSGLLGRWHTDCIRKQNTEEYEYLSAWKFDGTTWLH